MERLRKRRIINRKAGFRDVAKPRTRGSGLIEVCSEDEPLDFTSLAWYFLL